eukprot:6177266-Pleurochrysis_carterae.AAC.4
MQYHPPAIYLNSLELVRQTYFKSCSSITFHHKCVDMLARDVLSGPININVYGRYGERAMLTILYEYFLRTRTANNSHAVRRESVLYTVDADTVTSLAQMARYVVDRGDWVVLWKSSAVTKQNTEMMIYTVIPCNREVTHAFADVCWSKIWGRSALSISCSSD